MIGNTECYLDCPRCGLTMYEVYRAKTENEGVFQNQVIPFGVSEADCPCDTSPRRCLTHGVDFVRRNP